MQLRPVRVFAAVATLGLVLTACGGNKSDNATPTTAAKSATTTRTTVAAGGPDTPADPSVGCGTSTATAGETDEKLTVDGTERSYFLHVPPAHDGKTPIPVVLDFHGYSEGAAIHRAMSGMGTYGDEQGFVTVFPQGQGKVPKWIFDANATNLDLSDKNPDAVFVNDLLDRIENDLCVDQARVYSTGLSNGGMMTTWLSCIMSDRIAAAAPVAGVVGAKPCSPGRAVPVVAFHGTADPFLPYEGGTGTGVDLLKTDDGSSLADVASKGNTEMANSLLASTVPERMAVWAERNGCSADAPDKTQVTKSVSVSTWDCPAGADVQLYTVDGGGHAWPGSAFSASIESIVGPTTMEIDADEIMWKFFQQQALAPSS